MGTKIVKTIVLPLDQACPTDLPTQPGVYTRDKGGDIQPDPLPSRRPEGLTKEVLPTSLLNPFFSSSASPTNSYFYSSCDQDCLRKMLLITAKAAFVKVHQNNNSKQLNKHV